MLWNQPLNFTRNRGRFYGAIRSTVRKSGQPSIRRMTLIAVVVLGIVAVAWPLGGSEESAILVTAVSLALMAVGLFELLRSKTL